MTNTQRIDYNAIHVLVLNEQPLNYSYLTGKILPSLLSVSLFQ